MAHPTTIRHAVWDALRTFYRDVRRAIARSEEHGGPAIVVPRGADELTRVLGRAYFAPNWEFSYYERGETLNLARVEYEQRDVHHHAFEWWQTHVRGWEYLDDDQQVHTRLRPHWELEPTEHDQDHVDGLGLDIQRGVDAVASTLSVAGVPYTRYEELPPGGR